MTAALLLTSSFLIQDIIIGGGSAGCAIAARLSENPGVSVLLIEAGSNLPSEPRVNIPALFPETQKTSMDWDYTTSRQIETRNRPHYWPRGRVLGGSSSINAMLWVRGSKDDFNVWEKDYGCEGWGWDDLLPLFKRIEKVEIPKDEIDAEYHGFDGPVRVTRTTANDPCVWNYLWVRSCEALGVGCGPRGEVDPSKGFTNGVGPGGDYNGKSSFTAGIFMSSVADGVRQHTGRVYINPVIDPKLHTYRPNLTLLSDTMVTSIKAVFDPISGKHRATGVECVSVDSNGKPLPRIKPTVFMCKKEVVLSAGAINSPQVLMLSGIGPRDELQRHGINVINNLPGVGSNLHDHLIVQVGNIDLSKQTYLKTPGAIVQGVYKYATTKTGLLTTAGPEATAFFCTPSYLAKHASTRVATPPPNIQFHTLPFTVEGRQQDVMVTTDIEPIPLDHVSLDDLPLEKGTIPSKPLSTNFDGALQAKLNAVPGGIHLFMTLVTLVKPLSRGRVTLRSANPFDHPVIDPNYFGNPADVTYLVEGSEVARKVHMNMSKLAEKEPRVTPFGSEIYNRGVIAELRRVAYKRTGKVFPDHVLADTKAYAEESVRRSAITLYHPVGTCRMGPEDQVSTVVSSKDLKVLGFTNLRVADASIMPEVTSGNTNAPSIVIGERCADLIKAGWK
ncbi:GMC oxidoreductase-domain-containing protein [Cladochytrium replicatum]|nr:GMC oxidoreductase-domain-containing protein [Cladochytrium replicatum]